MTPNEKADELINKLKPRVYYYLGIGMLSNDYNKGVVTKNAIHRAIICVDEIIEQWDYINTYLGNGNGELNPNLKYFQEVKQILQSKL